MTLMAQRKPKRQTYSEFGEIYDEMMRKYPVGDRVRTQTEMSHRLKAAGHPVSQTTVSNALFNDYGITLKFVMKSLDVFRAEPEDAERLINAWWRNKPKVEREEFILLYALMEQYNISIEDAEDTLEIDRKRQSGELRGNDGNEQTPGDR
jgi:hypothetical protein